LFFDMVRIYPARQAGRWQGAAAGTIGRNLRGAGRFGAQKLGAQLPMLMRATGRGSISSILKLVVDVIWVLACALLGFFWIIAIISVVSALNGGSFLGIERVAYTDPSKVAYIMLNGSTLCIGVMIVCSYLRAVFETLVEGDPFVPANAKRFSLIAIVLAVMEGASMILTSVIGPLLSALGLAEENAGFVFPNINWPIWVAVITLLILAQVFREGAAMREEQKMTI
jgi:hypothetical protein